MAEKIRHDQLFKLVVGKKEAAKEVLQLTLPSTIIQELDLESLELQNDKYVDENLKEYLADLVFACRTKKKGKPVLISFILEHKSYVEPVPHVQLLQYLVNAYKRQLEQDKRRKKLTPVIPLVFYHGKQQWQLARFQDYFHLPNTEFARYIPHFHYDLLDLSRLPDEKIQQLETQFLVGTLMVMKHWYDQAYLLQQTEEIFIFVTGSDKVNRPNETQKALFLYYFQCLKLSSKKFKAMLDNLSNEMQQEFKSTYDYFIEEGEAKGKRKGETQKAVKVALSLFADIPHLSDQQVASIAGLEESLVTELRARSGQVHSLKQLLQQTFDWSDEDLDYLKLD